MSFIHNPSNFEPRDYEIVDYLDNKRPVYCGETVEEYKLTVKWWETDMQSVFGAGWRSQIHRCSHCGNGSVRWITAVRYIPTGDVVVFGAVCTARLGFEDKHAFKLAQLQSKAAARTERFAVYLKRAKYLAAHPEVKACYDHIKDAAHVKNWFAQDVLGKLGQYGELSEKQAAAVVASMDRDLATAERIAAEALQPKGEAPTGRIEVTGTVLSTKIQESQWGASVKMLIKLENNSKAWMTVPSGADVTRGDIVVVKATFEQSKDDKSFAFGKRPILLSKTA